MIFDKNSGIQDVSEASRGDRVWHERADVLGALCLKRSPDLEEMPHNAAHLRYDVQRALNFVRGWAVVLRA